MGRKGTNEPDTHCTLPIHRSAIYDAYRLRLLLLLFLFVFKF